MQRALLITNVLMFHTEMYLVKTAFMRDKNATLCIRKFGGWGCLRAKAFWHHLG